MANYTRTNVFFILGIAATTYGSFLLHLTLGWIVLGAWLIILALLAAVAEATKEKEAKKQ